MGKKTGTLLLLFCGSLLISKLNAQTDGSWPNDTVCLNETRSYSFNMTDPPPPQWWAWSMPGANPDTFYSTTSDQSPYFAFPEAGHYKLTLTVMLPDGTISILYAYVLALDPNPPANTLGNDSLYCGVFSRLLDAGNPGSNYLWNTGARTQTIQVNAAGTYTVDVSNACYSGSFDITLTQISAPPLDLGPDGFMCNEVPKTLIAGNTAYTYLWNSGETTPDITVSSAGTYAVTKTDANGCSANDEITLKDSCPPDLFVPTAFSPNNDGHNDVIAPYTNGIRSVEWLVYDRWGELVFSTHQVGEAWDGKFGGEPCMDGLYIWYLKAYDMNYKMIIQKGTFLLFH